MKNPLPKKTYSAHLCLENCRIFDRVTVVQLTWRAFFSASATAVITSHRMPILDVWKVTQAEFTQRPEVFRFSKHPSANFKPTHTPTTPTHAAWYCRSKGQHVHDRHGLTTSNYTGCVEMTLDRNIEKPSRKKKLWQAKPFLSEGIPCRRARLERLAWVLGAF